VQTGPLLDEAYIATGKVVAFYRHFPLQQIHPNAMPASKASYCAGQQAPKYFWGMHEWIFANQAAWSNAADAPAQFRAAALTLGVDGARYDTCLNDPKTEARINLDLEEGAALGIGGTPAFFVNDWFLAGAYPFSEFQKVIAKAEQGLHPPPTPTPLPPNVEPYDADPARPGFTYDGSPALGEAKAPLLVFIFSDFGCPACVEFAKNVQPTLREKYVKTGQMRLIYKFLPIAAPQTALAAFCAASQGKFWEFSDRLTADQGKWKEGDRAAMTAYAKTLGLDTAKFDKCLADAAGQAQLDADIDLAQQIQATQAPYFLVLNLATQTGLRIPNLAPLEQFEKVIQDIQKPQSAAPSAGAQPTPAPAAAKRPELPVGVDADGNFYRGDPKAPIKIIEYSDFQ
jgi:protein-disulfide isomerase